MKKEYTINGRKYYQQPLVIGQVSRLLAEMKGITLTSMTAMGLVAAFGDKMPRMLACVLIPEGGDPRTVDIDAMAAELWSVEVDDAMEVVSDFLSMAALGSRLEQIAGMMKTVLIKETGQTPSV